MSWALGGFAMLLAAIGLVWWRVNARAFDDVLSPFAVLFPFWILPYAFSLLRLSGLQRGLPLEAHAIIVLATVALIVPCVASMYLLRGDGLAGSLREFEQSPLRLPSGRALALVFLAACGGAFYLAVFAGRAIPLSIYLSGAATRANLHQAGMDSRLQILAAAVPVAGMMVFYLALTAPTRGARLLWMLCAGTAPVLGLLRANKTDVFQCALYYAAVAYYNRRRARRPMSRVLVVGAGVVVLVLITLMTTLRTAGIKDNPSLYSGLIAFEYAKLPFPLNEIFGILYGYSALTFENFGRFVAFGEERLRLGSSFFRPVLSLFMQGRMADRTVEGLDWHFVAPFANAQNSLTDLYAEGGALLCVLGPLAYSAFVNTLYVRFRRSGATTALFVYISFLFPWVWMFFTNAFSVLTFYVNWFYLLAIPGVALLLHRGILRTRVRRPAPDPGPVSRSGEAGFQS